jgi:BirA family biotin operon repressor/biotin-[acetyl-CoA-carboxylase] ligase
MLQPAPTASLPESWQALDRRTGLGHIVRHYERIDSTNAAANAWIQAGAPHGALVVAEHQTAGRGRYRRSWHAEPGKNLLMSLILRPTFSLDRLSVMPLLAGLACARAIDALATPVVASLKWPNDLYIEGKKCGGILVETSHSGRPGHPPEAVVLGIGLNVNQSQFPPDLASRATSLLLETGRFSARDALLVRFLDGFAPLYAHIDDEPIVQDYLEAYEARMYRRGEPVEVALPGGSRFGVAEGVTPAGALRLRSEAGLLSLHVGDLLAPPAAASNERSDSG